MSDLPDEDREDVVPPILRRTRGRLSPRRLMYRCCKLAGVVVALAVVAAGVLALRLQEGPIEIDGLGQKIASALHDRFGGGLDFDLGQTSMMQRGFGPTLAIDRLVVAGPDHQTVLSAPKAEVSVDPIALFFGKVSPKRLEVFDVTLRLVLLKNGTLAVAAGDGTKPFVEIGRRSDQDADPAQAPAAADNGQGVPSHRAIATKQASAALRQLVDILTNPRSPIAAVDRLGITRGKLVIEDQMTGEEDVYKDLDLAFDKAHGVTKLTLSAIGPNGRWTVTAQAEGRPGETRRFGLKAENLTIDEAQLAAGSRSLGFESDMPIAFSVDIGLSPTDVLQETSGSFTLGPGFLRMDDPDQEPILLSAVSGALHWNGTTRKIDVESLRYVEASGTRFSGSGGITPPLNEGEPWAVDLATTEPGLFAPDRKDQRPQPIENASFKGRLFLDRKTFVIDRMVVHGKEGGIALAGGFDWISGPHVKFGARIEPTTVAFAQRVWPAFMAATVRAWIVDHFEGGRLTDGTIQVDYDENALKRMRADRAPPDKSVSLDFELQDGRLRYLDGVPPIDHVHGIGHITGRTSRFSVTSGTIDASGRTIEVSDGMFFVPNTNRHPTPASLTAHLDGPVEAVTNILSRDALKPYASLPLDAATLHGRIEGTLEKSLMLGMRGDQPDEPLRVDAKVTDFVADHLIGQESLDNATLAINVDQNTLKATGQGRLFGGAATFEINRLGAGPPTAQIAVTLDDAAREKLGLSVVPGLTGPMTAHVNANIGDTAALKAQVDLDLSKTAVAAAYLGLTKPAGKPAKISFLVEPRDGRLSIDQLVVDVASLQARGSVDLAPDYSFQGAHFASFKVSPGDDMRLDVSKGDDMFKLTIRGSTIDARPFLKALTSTPVSDATPLSRNAKAEKKQVDAFKGFDVDMKTAS